MYKIIFAITIMGLLLGCGGGASDSERDTDQGRAVSDQTEGSSPVDEPVEVTNSWDIVTEEDFLFDASSSLSVAINLPTLYDRRAYLNLCLVNDHGEINYQNCLLKSPLRNGRFEKQLEIGNDVSNLSLAVWLYTGEDPLVYTWERSRGYEWVIDDL